MNKAKCACLHNSGFATSRVGGFSDRQTDNLFGSVFRLDKQPTLARVSNTISYYFADPPCMDDRMAIVFVWVI